jgi:Phosphoglucomutase/phosphomannomutase, alpha/beta/alpha domain I
VVFARDTRASGPHLTKALKASLDALGVEYIDYGILTTPMLHHMVRCLNTRNSPRPFGEASEEGYYKKMTNAFKKAMYGRKINGPVAVDCANGVGGPKLHALIKHLPDASKGGIDIKVVNDDVIKPEALNYEVRLCLSCEKGFADRSESSVELTSSKQSSVLLPPPTPRRLNDVVLLMEMPIALSTTSSMTTKSSICSMVTGLQLWQQTSLLIRLESLV